MVEIEGKNIGSATAIESSSNGEEIIFPSGSRLLTGNKIPDIMRRLHPDIISVGVDKCGNIDGYAERVQKK